MKKIIALALFAVMAVTASAQVYVGGSIGAWRDKTAHVTTANILPEIGYTLSDNLAIGTVIGWEHTHTTGISVNMFSVEPYARYTFFRSNIVGLFVEGGFGVGAGKASDSDGNKSDTATIWSIGFKPGISIKLSDSCSLIAKFGFLGYQGANDMAKDADYTDAWGFNFSGNSLLFGFNYTF